MTTRRAVLAAPLLALPFAARAAAPVVIRFSSAAPPSDFLARAMTDFKARVDKAAPGAFDIRLYPGSTLFRQGTEFPAIERGTLQMSTGTTFEVANELPAWGFLDRGYLFRDAAQMKRVFDGPIGAQYRREVAAKLGIEILAIGYLGTRQVALRTRREVRGPADLSGVKLRMVADPTWLLLGRALGASPVPMGMQDVYLALKTGTIDAEDNPLTILNAAKFYEVTQQVVLTSHMIQPVFFNVSAKLFRKLPTARQTILRDAARGAMMGNDTARLADEARVETALKAKGMTFTAIDLEAFRAYADKVYAVSPFTKPWDMALIRKVAAST